MALGPQETFNELVEQNNAYREQVASLSSQLERLKAEQRATVTAEEARILCLAITSSADRHDNPELTVLYKRLRSLSPNSRD